MEIAKTIRVTLTLPQDNIFLKYYEENPEWDKVSDIHFAYQSRQIIFEKVEEDLSAMDSLQSAGFEVSMPLQTDGPNRNGRVYDMDAVMGLFKNVKQNEIKFKPELVNDNATCE